MATDDQEVEAWYLEGWCFYLMAEQAKDNGTTLEDVTWEELAKNARDCLEACQVVRDICSDTGSSPLIRVFSFTQVKSTLICRFSITHGN